VEQGIGGKIWEERREKRGSNVYSKI